jgi:hypothetical protein
MGVCLADAEHRLEELSKPRSLGAGFRMAYQTYIGE